MNQSGLTDNKRDFTAGISVLPVLCDGFGIFVILGYHRKGVSVFAWLKTIEMIFIGVFLTFMVCVIGYLLFNTSQINNSNYYNIPTALLIVMFALVAIGIALKVIVIKYTFKLARLLKSDEQFNNLTV
ncbi:unnamed protein product [Rotaria magnacalcarata]